MMELIKQKDAISTLQRVLIEKIDEDPLAVSILNDIQESISEEIAEGNTRIDYRVTSVCSDTNLRYIRDLISTLGYQVILSERSFIINLF